MADEVLVVGYQPDATSPSWPVLARASSQALVLRAAAADVEAVGRRARLAMARRPDGSTQMVGDSGVLDELDEGGRLFVRAWQEQPTSKPDRRGEGLPWDHPGFEPPDIPPRQS